MKQNIIPAIRLTLALALFFMGVYTLLVFGGAQLSTGSGEGETVIAGSRVVGYKLIGQKFTDNKYFWSRPSAVDYNAAGSGGSNKGPNDSAYLATVQLRINTFLAHNPLVQKAGIPCDLVTASGSGLDPDISVPAALIQVKRIAAIRNIREDQLITLVNQCIEPPLLGFLGPEKVNVLKLNIGLDNLK